MKPPCCLTMPSITAKPEVQNGLIELPGVDDRPDRLWFRFECDVDRRRDDAPQDTHQGFDELDEIHGNRFVR